MTNSTPKNLVFMDLDGTITRKDTYIEFIRFCYPGFRFYAGFILLAPLLVLYSLGIVSGSRTKEQVLSYFFKGMEEKQFLSLGLDFSMLRLPALIRKEAVKEISLHKEQEARIVVVTASFSAWVKGWCDSQGLELIATRYEVSDGVLTGRIEGLNCKGQEKVRRIVELYDLDDAKEIFAYGNARSDMEMLNIADIKYMRWRRKR